MLYRLVLTGMLLLHTLSKAKNVHVLQVKFDIKFALDSLRDKPAKQGSMIRQLLVVSHRVITCVVFGCRWLGLHLNFMIQQQLAVISRHHQITVDTRFYCVLNINMLSLHLLIFLCTASAILDFLLVCRHNVPLSYTFSHFSDLF